MDFPLTKKAGVVGSAIKVLNHPGATAAVTALSLAPAVSGLLTPAPAPNKRVNRTQDQGGEMTKLQSFPSLKCGSLVNLAIGAANALGTVSSVASLIPSSKGSPKASTPPATDSFTSNKTSAVTTPDGSVETSSAVKTLRLPAPSSAEPARSVPKSPMSAGASKSFKVARMLSMPNLKAGLDTASQLAVIGVSALPFYGMYQDAKQQRQDEGASPAAELRALQSAQSQPDLLRKTSIASLLPLAPKSSILHRLNDGVKDFGEGAYNALDHAAEQILTPNMQLDPASHRIPSISQSV